MFKNKISHSPTLRITKEKSSGDYAPQARARKGTASMGARQNNKYNVGMGGNRHAGLIHYGREDDVAAAAKLPVN